MTCHMHVCTCMWSQKYLSFGEMEQTNVILELPPSVSCNKCVKQESVYGIFRSFPEYAISARMLTTFLQSYKQNWK